MSDNKRPTADVEVELLGTDNVKVNNDFTIKNFYKLIFGKEQYTTSREEYKQSISGEDANIEKDNNKDSNAPKFFVSSSEFGPSLTLLGNALIATPVAANFQLFPATFEAGGDADEVSYKVMIGNPADGPPIGDESFIIAPRGGNTLKGPAGVETAETNTWKPGFHWEELSDGGLQIANPYANSKTVESSFKLGKNQPFSLIIRLDDFTPEQIADINADDDKDPNKLVPNVRIFFDGKNNTHLTYYQDGKVSFVYGGKILNLQTLPQKAEDKYSGTQLTIYPLGNYIYVYSGVPTTAATMNKEYIVYNLGRPVDLGGDHLFLEFRCGTCYFNFSPIIHPSSGKLTSPLFSGGFIPDSTAVVCGHVGKFGTGARGNGSGEFEISFPDANDREKFYEYLKDYKIKHSVESLGSNLFVYTMTLDVPNDVVGKYDAMLKDTQDKLKEIQKEVVNEIVAVANSQKTVEEGDSAATSFLSNRMQSIASNLSANGVSDSRLSDVVAGAGSEMGDMVRNLFRTIFGGTSLAANERSTMFNFGFSNVDFSTLHSDEMFFGQTFGEFTFGVATERAAKNFAKSFNALKVKEAGKNIYSPAVFFSNITLIAKPQSVGMNPSPQIDNCDVIRVSVDQAVEESSATVVLKNRQGSCGSGATQKGKYTYVPGSNTFCGIKPIQIKLGLKGDPNTKHTVFTGYVTDRSYSRQGAQNSTCTLQCVDMSKKARETFASNLPFFDGFCHMAALHYLAREAGYSDDQILFSQDPVSGRKIRIRDLIIGDPDTFTGGCYDGHVHEDPPGLGGLGGSYLHATLPMAIIGVDQANYNFTFGTPLWSCMQRIRDFTQWYLYANNFGNIVYGPKSNIIVSSGKEFKEVGEVGAFNEIQRHLDVSYSTNDTRNAVFIQGLTFSPTAYGSENGGWGPHVHIRRKSNFPNDVGDTSFAPYLRYVFWREPKFELPSLAHFATEELFRRAIRLKADVNFSAWGQSDLFPYMILAVVEDNNETGIKSLPGFIVAAHTISADAGSNFQLMSEFSLETLDPGSLNYDPNVIANLRE